MTDLTHPPRFNDGADCTPSRKTGRGPALRLRNALDAMSGGHARIERHAEKAWASITFAGTRHTLSLVFDGPVAVEAGENFVAELPDYEFSLPGQLVADAAITGVETVLLPEPRLAVECEILVLNEA